MHNPNPFDFVPFAERPILRDEAEYNMMEELYSGYLEVSMKALTPVHVVGYQEPDDNGRKSHLYKQNGRPCIPAATIRGCLRSFIEALTAGFASQSNSKYEKVYGGPPGGPKNPKGRHIGFSTFDWYVNKHQNSNSTSNQEPAVDPMYNPSASTGLNQKLDIASYLFGIVVEKEEGSEARHDYLARKSRVWIEDAEIDLENLNKENYWVPDITGEAFMGGAKPSASNWWYMEPAKIQTRKKYVEFVGEKYWGRKFYYHQRPENCIRYYDPNQKKDALLPAWNYREKNPFCKVHMECLATDASTNIFRIYVNRIPRQLLILLVLCLLPGENIRHKLGYGKQYGYGSIEFSIHNAMLREEDNSNKVPRALQDKIEDIQEWQKLAWNQELMTATGFDVSIIDMSALYKIAQILGIQNFEKLTFTYPPFIKEYFSTGLTKAEFNSKADASFQLTSRLPIASENARNIAEIMFSTKKPIHFQLYQEKSTGWNIITARKP